MKNRKYAPEESFPLPTDVDSLVAFLEERTSHIGVFGDRLREAYVRKDAVGNSGRAWKLTFHVGITGHAYYAQAVIFHVTQISAPGAHEQLLLVRAVCHSNDLQSVRFYDGLLERIKNVWHVKELDRTPQQPDLKQRSPDQSTRQSPQLPEWQRNQWVNELEKLAAQHPIVNSAVWLNSSAFTNDEKILVAQCWMHAKEEGYRWSRFENKLAEILHAKLTQQTVNRWARPLR